MSKEAIQEVNVESLFGALNTTGKARLSDHATPVDQGTTETEQPQGATETETAERTTTETTERTTEKPMLRFVDYSEKDFATDNEDVMEMIEQTLDDYLYYVWTDDGGYLYPPQDDLRPTAEEICKAIHEQF